MIGPVVYTLLALVVAGIVHLSTVLVMPWVATRDGFLRANALARDNAMTLLSTTEVRTGLPFADPAQAVAVCRYVLERGPVRVRLPVGTAPISVLFLRKGAGIYHSLTDKAATQGILDIIVASPEQIRQITALDSDDEPVQEIRITSGDDLGLVVIRALVPTPSERDAVDRLLRTATCEVETLER